MLVELSVSMDLTHEPAMWQEAKEKIARLVAEGETLLGIADRRAEPRTAYVGLNGIMIVSTIWKRSILELLLMAIDHEYAHAIGEYGSKDENLASDFASAGRWARKEP